jgi:TetR/AcrR family transcriptional regulator, fatty acid biosynthesis regulator
MVLRPKPEKVEERERIRRSLLRATVTLAAKHGFAGLGLREVARGADIAPTSFYRHFTDMEELALALVAELIGPLLARWNEQARRPASEPHQPIQRLIDEALRTVREEPDLMRFILAERVGAVRTCRTALRSRLSELATALSTHWLGPIGSHTGHGEDEHEQGQARCEAVVTLLLDSCAVALDIPADEPRGLDRLRLQLESQLRPLLRAASENKP